MATIVDQIHAAFSLFKRPACVVVHPGDDCFDCPDVANVLASADCESILRAERLVFNTFPMDCMNADAILHYLPAIAKESLHPDGKRTAETVAWIFGADDWDTELTISEQINPKLNREQRRTICELLTAIGDLELSSHACDQLQAARKFWCTRP